MLRMGNLGSMGPPFGARVFYISREPSSRNAVNDGASSNYFASAQLNRRHRKWTLPHHALMVRAPTGELTIMMYLETPPKLIETTIFSAMPDNFRRKGVATEWADANRPGAPTDCFIEGPSFDKDGNLYIVDIPFGRIFRI